MKNTIRVALIAATFYVAASSAMADFQANLGPHTSTLGGYGTGSFGVALRDVAPLPGIPTDLRFGPSASQSWGSGLTDAAGRTFCVESVLFNTNTWYYATVDTTVIKGGPGQNTSLTAGTRTAFASYVLGLVDPGLDAKKNQAMQAYFWDQQLVNSTGSTWYDAIKNDSVKLAFYNSLVALQPTGQEAMVRVLNLWQGAPYATDKQSHLTMIPAPGAVLLGMLGFSLIGWFRRRFA